MDARQLAALAEHLRDSGIGEQARNYDRYTELIVTDGSRDVVRIHVLTGGGELRIDTDPPPGRTGLVVRITAEAALTIGTGQSLIEDEFAAGAITLDGVQPDDYRQAPVLERLIEGMADIGVLPGVEAA